MATRNTVWRWNDMRDQRRNRKAPLERFLEPWLLSGNFSAKTVKGYREVFQTFLGWMREQGNEGVLGELDPLLVRKWQAEMEAKGRSVNTVRGYLATLKSLSRFLADEGYVRETNGRSLDLLVDVKVPKLPRTRPQVYKDGEIEEILSGIDRFHLYGARNSALVRLMLDGGLRLNEACQLRPEDIDWSTGRIHIRWQSAKRRKERDTYVGRRTLVELRRYLEEYRPKAADVEQLFVDQDGGPLTTHAVQCVLSRLRKKLGMTRLSAHQFRRTWATNYRKMGVGDLYDLQQEGGWEDLEVPQRFYVDLNGDRPGRPSVMDRWETQQRKQSRAIQVREVVQGIQVRERRESAPEPPKGTTSNGRKRGV